MTLDVSDVAIFLTAVVTAVGMLLAAWQLWRIQITTRNNVVSSLYQESGRIRTLLLERPHLRKYFYDNVEISPDHDEYGYVLTLAEIYMNFQEHKTFLKRELGRDWAAWRLGRDRIIASSPIMRSILHKYPVRDGDELLRGSMSQLAPSSESSAPQAQSSTVSAPASQ